MIIGIDATSLAGPNTGIEQYIINIVNNLLQVDDRNEYLLYCRSDMPDGIIVPATNLEFKKCCVKNRKVFQQTRLARLAKKDLVDVMFYPGNTLALFSSIPSVLTVHDIFPIVIPNEMPKYHENELLAVIGAQYWRQINIWSARRANNIVSVSESTKKDLMEHLKTPEEKIAVIHEGPAIGSSSSNKDLTPDAFRAKHQLNSPFILCVGTGTYKNVQGSIAAFTEVKKDTQYAALKLVITGPDVRLRNDVKAVFSASDAKNDIIFTGFFPDDDMPMLYQCAEVLLFPSFYEGFGIPILEAFSFGLPVITSNVSSMPEVAGDAALLVNPHDKAEIVAAIGDLLNSKELRSRLREQGTKHLREFSWRTAAHQTLKVLSDTGTG